MQCLSIYWFLQLPSEQKAEIPDITTVIKKTRGRAAARRDINAESVCDMFFPGDMQSEYVWRRKHCWRCKSGAFRAAIRRLLARTPAALLRTLDHTSDGIAKYTGGFLLRLPHRLHTGSKRDPPQREGETEGRGGEGNRRQRRCQILCICDCACERHLEDRRRPLGLLKTLI